MRSLTADNRINYPRLVVIAILTWMFIAGVIFGCTGIGAVLGFHPIWASVFRIGSLIAGVVSAGATWFSWLCARHEHENARNQETRPQAG